MNARPDDPDFRELCPCCGGDGIYVDSCSDCAALWSVGCTTCGLHNNADTRADALAAWNRRAALSPAPQALAGEAREDGINTLLADRLGPWAATAGDDQREAAAADLDALLAAGWLSPSHAREQAERIARLEAALAKARERIEMARLLTDTGAVSLGKTMDYSPSAVEAILRHLDTALAALTEGGGDNG